LRNDRIERIYVIEAGWKWNTSLPLASLGLKNCKAHSLYLVNHKYFDLNSLARLNPAPMKLSTIFPLQSFSKIFAIVMLASLAGCSGGMPKLFWDADEGAGKPSAHAQIKAEARPVLDVPPSLRGQVSVPDAESVAVKQAMPERYKKSIAGKAVALDARVYDLPTGAVFSAVIDAMTSLNFPVQSVDSASGTVTTDWVRQGVDSSVITSAFNSLTGTGVQATRHRFVVRVLRQATESGVDKSRLEIRTLAQVYQNKHWQNKKLLRKKADELFVAVEERLARP